MSRTTLRTGLLLLSLSLGAPGLALADEEIAAHEATEDAEHGVTGEGHGPISLHEIVAGHERWQFWGAVFNFGLLVFVIIRMAKKPTQAFLNERRSKIEHGIEEAAQAKTKAEAVQREYTERLATLDQELSKLRADIAAAAASDRARIVAEAEESAKRVTAETEQLVARKAEQLETDIRREVVAAAITAAERAVKEVATADDQRRLAETFARELGQLSGGAGSTGSTNQAANVKRSA